jgi:hypothetical protein
MFALGLFIGGFVAQDPNAKARWGATGTPVNCQALIAENIRGWKTGEFAPENALNSIDRWCGLFGQLWGK